MPIITFEFKVDKIQLLLMGREDLYLGQYHKEAANRLGKKICEQYPFKKIEVESYKGEIPDPRFTYPFMPEVDHPYRDVYRNELMVIPKDKWDNFKNQLCGYIKNKMESVDHLESECNPEESEDVLDLLIINSLLMEL